MRLFSRFACFAVVALIPFSALAFQQTIWDFRGGQLPGTWRVSGAPPPQTTDQGLAITVTSPDLTILTPLVLPHAVDVIQVTALTEADLQVTLLWHRAGDPPDRMVQLPFLLPGGAEERTADMNLAAFPQWDPQTDTIGFIFPQGANVILRDIHFAHWNLFEKTWEIAKSFWIFDSFTPVVINFLWGPVITTNPLGTHELFTTLPPRGRSGMWLFYGAIAVMAALIAAHRVWMGRNAGWVGRLRIGRASGHLMLFLACYGALWVIFDIRMGAEILSYVKQDYDTWHSQPPGKRVLRTYLHFNDAMEQMLPLLEGIPEMGLVKGPETPIDAMTRYFALPTVVREPSGPRDDVRAWFVFNHRGAAVDAEGRLTVNGVPWSAPGTIVKQFDPTSFFFRTNVPSP